MAAVNGHHGCHASPNSSEELHSNQATPATKVSLCSPLNVCESLKPTSTGIVRSKIPPAFLLTQAPTTFAAQHKKAREVLDCATQDPFVSTPTLSTTTQSATDTSKLSPVASTFTPQSLLIPSTRSSIAHSDSPGTFPQSHQQVKGLQSKLVGLAAPSGLSIPQGLLNSPLRKSDNKTQNVSASSLAKDHQFQFPGEVSSFQDTKQGPFSTDKGVTRCLMVRQVAADCPVAAIEAFFSPSVLGSVKSVILTDLVTASVVYVRFGDLRDVVKATDTIKNASWGWSIHFIDPQIYAFKAQPGSAQPSSTLKYEAQVLVTVTSFKTDKALKAEKSLVGLVFEFLSRSGDLMALEELRFAKPTEIVYRAEFYSVDAVDRLLRNGSCFEFDHFIFDTKRYEPHLEATYPQSSKRLGPLIIGEDEMGLDNALQSMSLNGNRATTQQEIMNSVSMPSFVESTPVGCSLTSRKDFAGSHTPSSLNNSFNGFDHSSSETSPLWSPAYTTGSSYGIPSSIWSTSSPGAVGQERGALLSPSHSDFFPHQLSNGTFHSQPYRNVGRGGRRPNEHNIGTHNVVDMNRIRLGIDVRTTIMLRNIPNKMTSAVLKGILDETSFGKYDFTYLRIDFANNCNVGYAFINFEDPIFIVNFVNARAGRRWNCYNSDKVAEISYATIQGRDCLVQKFRNSSVMLEQPSSRPKIWSTAGATMGQEEAFPGPDNPSKMRRSVENAEHVGLFAPRAGQCFRDEQRRRRSQYDRGTRFADIEESLGSTAYQYHGTSNVINAQPSPATNYQQQAGQIYYSHFSV